MKYAFSLLAVILVGCGARKDTIDSDYLAAVKTEQEAYYGSDAQRAYDGERSFIDFVQQMKRDGHHLPNPDVLLWHYPRLALVAEHLGKKEEASQLFAMTERYAKQLYPNEPETKTSVAAFRSALERMDPPEKAQWKN